MISQSSPITNDWDLSYSCSYGLDHSNTLLLQIRTSKHSDLNLDRFIQNGSCKLIAITLLLIHGSGIQVRGNPIVTVFVP